MENTRLILLEGLPGTGKSTNSQFLSMQLPLNGQRARWIHEVASPHPVLFFDEANLTHAEYEAFLRAFPQAGRVLSPLADLRENTVGLDLLQVEWHHLDEIGPGALEALQTYSVMAFPLEQYADVALEKWAHFTQRALQDDVVTILDSALFQYQIFTFLLQNTPYPKIEALEYADIAGRLFAAADCRKLAIEISRQDWTAYEDQILVFLGAGRKPYPKALPPDGLFINEALNETIEINGLSMKDPFGTRRVLTPKSDTEFYVENLPILLRFPGTDQVEITGGQIPDRWTIPGTTFDKT